MRTENRSLTPTLAEVIQTAIDANLINLHVCLPAKIVTYDADTQTASLLPSLLKTYEDDTVLPWPIIPNVPIVFPKATSGQSYIHMPLIPGDDVVMLICERSLDNWKETGTLSDPDDRRQFDITDAFAFPGGSAGPFVFKPDDPLAIEIKNILGLLQVKPTGEFNFKNEVTTINADAIGNITVKNAVASVTITPAGTMSISAPLLSLGESAAFQVGLGQPIEARLAALELNLAALIVLYNAHIAIPLNNGVVSPPFIPIPTPVGSLTVSVAP